MRLADNEHCTGCGACVNACPFGALAMVRDAEGFSQPQVDPVKCVECGKCARSCPILTPPPLPEQIKKNPLCGCSLSEEIWRESASGGAFSEVCAALSEDRPVVFGARFKNATQVVHDFVERPDRISPFRKSKYVQSDIGLEYGRCREFLEDGRMVVFSGTPCQIAGLRGFLGKDYENLITIEFICHGVGSPSVFVDFLQQLERSTGKKIASYTFRHKTSDEKLLNRYVSRAVFADGSTRVYVDDLYNQLFLSQVILRRSCVGNCAFRNENRYADITLCDSRGEKLLYPDKDARNWSALVANTPKGAAVIEKLRGRMTLEDYPYELLKEKNPLYWRDVSTTPPRREFFRQYQSGQELAVTANRLGLITPKWKKLAKRVIGRIKRIVKKGF